MVQGGGEVIFKLLLLPEQRGGSGPFSWILANDRPLKEAQAPRLWLEDSGRGHVYPQMCIDVCTCALVGRHSTYSLPSLGQPWELQGQERRWRPAPCGRAWHPGPGEPLEAVPGGREDRPLPAERGVHEGAATQSRLPSGPGKRWYTGWGPCGHFFVTG